MSRCVSCILIFERPKSLCTQHCCARVCVCVCVFAAVLDAPLHFRSSQYWKLIGRQIILRSRRRPSCQNANEWQMPIDRMWNVFIWRYDFTIEFSCRAAAACHWKLNSNNNKKTNNNNNNWFVAPYYECCAVLLHAYVCVCVSRYLRLVFFSFLPSTFQSNFNFIQFQFSLQVKLNFSNP